MRSPVIRDMFPALVDAAHTIGAVQTRNLGTLGGNLVTGVPSMDSGPTLMALDALGDGRQQPRPAAGAARRACSSARARPSSSPTNCWSRSSFPRRISASRRIPEVRPAQGPGTRAGQCRRRLLGRRAQGHVRRAAHRARRGRAEGDPRAEGRSVSRGPRDHAEAMAEAGRIAATDAKPISDFRACADYRRESGGGAHEARAGRRATRGPRRKRKELAQ